MSVVEEVDADLVTRTKRLLLEAYLSIRRRPWLLPLFIGLACFAVGYAFDPATPLVEHGVFAGMFVIWGVTSVIFGVLVFIITKGLVLYSRYKETS